MTPTKPNVVPAGLYGRQQTMDALGISSSGLYKYTEQGKLPAQTRRANGRKVWRGQDIINLWNQIY